MLSTVVAIQKLGNFGAVTEDDLAAARRTAATQLRRMVGETLYETVAADDTHEAYQAFTDAENALSVAWYLPTRNINAQGDGVLKSTSQADGNNVFLTPSEIGDLQSDFLQMAEVAVAQWLTVTSAPPVRAR